MKKVLSLVTALLMMTVLLAGCTDNAVKKVEEQIEALSLERLDYQKKKSITEANDAYNALRKGQQGKVENAAKLRAAVVASRIHDVSKDYDVIGSTVYLKAVMEKKSIILEAKQMYDSLTSDEKKLVPNAKDLDDAVDALSKAETHLADAQAFAGKLCASMEKKFKSAITVKLVKAWFSTSTVEYDYTFQFEIRDMYGTETVYYGAKIIPAEFTDATLSKAMSTWGNSVSYVKKDDTYAMKNGIELNTDRVNYYTIKNK